MASGSQPQLDIKAVGDEAAARNLKSIAERGDDPRPVFKQIMQELAERQPAWFATHGEGSWPKLDASTLRKKSSKGQPSAPLIATGALLHSLTARRGGSSQALRSATKQRMKFGTRVYYARFHQGGHGVPVRHPLIPLDQRTRRRMVNDVSAYMSGKRKGITF